MDSRLSHGAASWVSRTAPRLGQPHRPPASPPHGEEQSQAWATLQEGIDWDDLDLYQLAWNVERVHRRIAESSGHGVEGDDTEPSGSGVKGGDAEPSGSGVDSNAEPSGLGSEEGARGRPGTLASPVADRRSLEEALRALRGRLDPPPGRQRRRERQRARAEAWTRGEASRREYQLRLQRTAGVEDASFCEIGPDGLPRIPSDLLSSGLDKAAAYEDELESAELVKVGSGEAGSLAGQGRPPLGLAGRLALRFRRAAGLGPDGPQRRRGEADWVWGVYARPERVEAALGARAKGRRAAELAVDPAFLEAVTERARELELSLVAVARRPVPLGPLLARLGQGLEREMRREAGEGEPDGGHLGGGEGAGGSGGDGERGAGDGSAGSRALRHPLAEGELEDLSEFIRAIEETADDPESGRARLPTQAELDEYAEAQGYASCSEDDDDETAAERASWGEPQRERARAKRRAARHRRNVVPATDETPLPLPGEAHDPDSDRLRQMCRAAGLPVRGDLAVRAVFDAHLERRGGEPYLRAGTHLVFSTADDGTLATEIVSPGPLRDRDERLVHVSHCRRLRSALFSLVLGPGSPDARGRASVGLGLAVRALGRRPPADGIATLEAPGVFSERDARARPRVDLSPRSFFLAQDSPDRRLEMLLRGTGRYLGIL